jgi:hypothetical protein
VPEIRVRSRENKLPSVPVRARIEMVGSGGALENISRNALPNITKSIVREKLNLIIML